MSLPCIITGCALITGEGWVAGDLFDADPYLVFNGNYDPGRGKPLWLPLSDQRYARTMTPSDWFERRGLFVIHKRFANLNAAAQEHIA